MVDKNYLALIISLFVVTYIPRFLPLFFLSRKELPKIVIEWLDLIPASILSAILLPNLITEESSRIINFMRPEFFTAIPTFLIAIKSKSLGITVISGMFFYWILGMF